MWRIYSNPDPHGGGEVDGYTFKNFKNGINQIELNFKHI
jgi:hypothetical protein